MEDLGATANKKLGSIRAPTLVRATSVWDTSLESVKIIKRLDIVGLEVSHTLHHLRSNMFFRLL